MSKIHSICALFNWGYRLKISKPRILFVSHDAYRAGATIFLLNMLRWFATNTDLHFSVAMRNDGEMVEPFTKICETYVLSDIDDHVVQPLSRIWFRKFLQQSKTKRVRLQTLIDSGRFDLVYMNTITMGGCLKSLNLRGLPVLTHVHELPSAIRRFAGGFEGSVINASDCVICVSDVVANNIIQKLFCPPNKVRRIYGFVPVKKKPIASCHELRKQLLSPLGIPSDALVVGMCGVGDIRKGVDLIVPLVRMIPLTIKGREVHFVWLGAQSPEYSTEVALDDSLRAGVSPRLHFPGVSKDPGEWMSLFDLHVLLSREDPFPLVVMEAACHGVPTVCFEESGGAPEFVQNDAGATVPYLDLPAFAMTLINILSDDNRRGEMGSIARQRVESKHAPEVVLPEIYQTIIDVFAKAQTTS
jgi:glycosyltransferase involved in cell wall biosynthesis